MAGEWIKFEVATSDKPEVWAIARDLSIDPDAVVGKLLRIWRWFDEQTLDGNAPSVSTAMLDRDVGVAGFCDAMVRAGWMCIDDKIALLPNFDRHNGKTAKKRALTARRVAKLRRRGNGGDNADVTHDVTQSALAREEKIYTVPKGTGAVAPDDPSEDRTSRIWRLWLELVGKTPANRKVLGGFIKEFGEPAVAEAVTATYAKQPAEPVAYLRSCLKAKDRGFVC